jgi:hypothetical protein
MNRNAINTRNLVLAGLAGGMAEVTWVAAWCAVSPLAGGAVLGGITASVFPAWADATFAPTLGLLIHFTLSVALALAFGLAFARSRAVARGAGSLLSASVLALAAVWTFNFFVLLPAINPAFVTLMPYPVTLISKLLFGVAMGAVLLRAPARSASRPEAIAAHA